MAINEDAPLTGAPSESGGVDIEATSASDPLGAPRRPDTEEPDTAPADDPANPALPAGPSVSPPGESPEPTV